MKVNGKSVYFLVDTGASIALVDITKTKELGYKLGSKLSSTIVGAGG
nr:MAG TPA: retropepsin-like protein [Caudoviricetes sp.]